MGQIKAHNSKPVHITRWFISILILVIIVWLLYIEIGQLLCRIAIRQIAELTNTNINVESVNFRTNGSVVINNIVISPKKGGPDNSDILEAKKVYAHFSPGSLLLLRPSLNIIDVNDFVFNAQYDMDTGWSNLSELTIKPPKSSPEKIPLIDLKNGTLLYTKISGEQEKVAVSIPVEASFGFDEGLGQGHNFSITTATMSSGYGKSSLKGSWKPGIITFAGGISSVNVSEFEMAWIIDVLAGELQYDQDDDFSLKLRVDNMHCLRSEEPNVLTLEVPVFLEDTGLFVALQGFLDRYQPRGTIDVDLEFSGNFKKLGESSLEGTLDCKDIGFCYYKFQYPIENLVGRIDFTSESVTLHNLSGEHGDFKFFFDGWCKYFGSDRQYQVKITSDNMSLDSDLYGALNPQQKKFWSAFSPKGQVAVEMQLNRQSQDDEGIAITLDLLGVEAVYDNFQYPLKNLEGKLIFNRDKILLSNIISQVNERRICLNGEITNSDEDKSVYDIEIDVNNIPLDSTLEEVLSEENRKLYTQINPEGMVDGNISVSSQGLGYLDYTADLSFKDSSLKSEQFPLPISDISAQVVFAPDMIDIKSFSGQYGENRISVAGQFYPDVEQENSSYQIFLNSEEMVLNNDVYDLLPESLKIFIEKLEPGGEVNLNAVLNKGKEGKPLDYTITINCLNNTARFQNFPYTFEDINGAIIIDTNTIDFEDLSMVLSENNTTNNTTATLNGDLILLDKVLSNAYLSLSVENINFDDQIFRTLPEQYQGIYKNLSPDGKIDIDFENIKFNREDDGNHSIEFIGAVKFKNCSFDLTDAKAKLDATVQTEGLYRTEGGLDNFKGVIENGRLVIQDKIFTDLMTNIYYDPNQHNWFTENLIANCYGGKITGKFELNKSDDVPMQYVLQAAFSGVELTQLYSYLKLGEESDDTYASGTMSGSLNIGSQVADQSSRIGTCRINITNMKVGKLSLVGKLLQVLNLTEPSDYAFDQMYVDSYIRHNEMYIEKLDLSGKGIAFYGSGSLNLITRDINLILTARGRRLATDDPSLLQSLTEGLGQAVVKMEVTGNFNDPKVETRTLPVLEETLQILGTKPATSD